MRKAGFEREVANRLKGAKKIVVMAVGDELDPRDCIGILAGRKISSARLKRVKVLQTSQMPENFTSLVRREKPSHVVVVDATDFGGRPGEIALIDPEQVAATRVSTHAMPLSVIMAYLSMELATRVLLVGIQPPPLNGSMTGETILETEKGILRLNSIMRKAILEGKT